MQSTPRSRCSGFADRFPRKRWVPGRWAAQALILASATGASGLTTLHHFRPDIGHANAPLASDSAGNLYGTTCGGGATNNGTIFTVKADGSGFAVLHAFTGGLADGKCPLAGLYFGGSSVLYGTTSGGGAADQGTVFTIRTDGSGFEILHSFVGGADDGSQPWGALVGEGTSGLFGTTFLGGVFGYGTVFRIDKDGTGFAVLHSFNLQADGSRLVGGLTTDGAGTLYGTAGAGGASSQGTVFSVGTDGSNFTLLHEFGGGAGDGSNPEGGLLAYDAGALYGMTAGGGAMDGGTLFVVGTDGGSFEILHSFGGGPSDGFMPNGNGLVVGDAGDLYGITSGGGEDGLGTVFTIRTDGSGFSLLRSFAGGSTDGSYPLGALVSDGTGHLYGATLRGGAASGYGTVFTIGMDGSGYAVLHSCTGVADGGGPVGGLVSGGDGKLYGATALGGTLNQGTVFAIQPDGGGFAVLHSFAGGSLDGRRPQSGLIVDVAGNLYGTTGYGGTADSGTVFTVKTDGSGFAVLHSFGGSPDGARPSAALVADTLGYLYGTTLLGGAANLGTVFRIRMDGTDFAVLHSFTGGSGDGSSPSASLTCDGQGRLYGTTRNGGSWFGGTVFTIRTDGTGYALLHQFSGSSDGWEPHGDLLLDATGNLFGTTSSGNTLFTLRTDGSGFAVLFRFMLPYGSRPECDLVTDGAGNLYGTTLEGGANGQGTVFRIRTDGSGPALLHVFGSSQGGRRPGPGLVFDGAGNLCGVASTGGLSDMGTVFSLALPRGTDTPAIYRSSDRSWYLKNSNTPGAADLIFPYGDPSDQAVKGDWDGDGDDTVGIYRDGVFFLKNTNEPGNADLVIGFGVAGDIPVAGDWDGDGIDTIGVYRPTEAAWFLRNTNAVGAPDLAFTYGLANETPITGDWDGDGIDTVGIFRASDRQWYLHNSNASGDAELVFPYGDPAQDVPVVGDWDGDGDDTVGIYRAALGEWFLKNTNEAGFADLNFVYGLVNEKPLAGDWDGQ
jgi:uncharacterized repeat protein (TIGR03803 family)